MQKKSAHEVVLHWLRMHLKGYEASGDIVYELLTHSSAVKTLCEVLKEMFIPEEDRLHVANELLRMCLECGPDTDLAELLAQTLPEIEKGYDNKLAGQ